MQKTEELLVIGYGRLGALIAKYLNQQFSVSILDKNKLKEQQARDAGFKTIQQKDIGRFKTIYLAVPINKFERLLDLIKDSITKDTLVIDTCSVKLYPVKLMKEKLKDCYCLGTHPIFGPDSANNGLDGFPMVMCPINIGKSLLNKWIDFWSSQGVKVMISTADEHDREMAYSLGLTHFIGRILGEVNLKELDMASKGYNSLLEIVTNTNNDSWELFRDMQSYNPYTLAMRDNVYAAIRKLENRLNKSINGKFETTPELD